MFRPKSSGSSMFYPLGTSLQPVPQDSFLTSMLSAPLPLFPPTSKIPVSKQGPSDLQAEGLYPALVPPLLPNTQRPSLILRRVPTTPKPQPVKVLF